VSGRESVWVGWLTEGKPRWWVYLLLAAMCVAIYLAAAGLQGVQGFPLDDAWIHQTYARSLALRGRWEYVPGHVSAGSTAPLWTLLLAAGYRTGVPYFWWTWGLGTLLLGLCGWLAQRLAERLFPQAGPRWVPSAVGLLCVGEWHLVWAAVSGMETLLFIALSLVLMERVACCALEGGGSGRLRQWADVGVAAALLVLTRPEGIVVVALGGLVLIWHGRSLRGLLLRAVAGALPFAALILPYLLFNYRAGGRLWPNTYYAKQAEYSALLASPFVARLARVLLPPLTGFQILLVPGLGLAVVKGIRRIGTKGRSGRWLVQSLPLASALSHLGLYAWRLPVTYQHGRYLMPVIPSLILYGVIGTAGWLRPGHSQFLKRVVSRSAAIAMPILLVAFLVVGAGQFAKDVSVIEGEMVTVARWLAGNTAADEWIAAHDIGAIGYFAGRPILDLAGLISPEVGPLLQDEEALAEYILDSPAHYLVSAPGWPYREITSRPDVSMLFSADFELTLQEGMNSSAVYRLR
jgi:hypothetical protein